MFQFRNDKNLTGIQTEKQSTAINSTLLEPKEVEINGCKFLISKMPCTVAQEVIVKLPTGFIPMLSNFETSQEMAFKMLSYCERIYGGDKANVPLISKEIIDNHVPDFNTLIQLEAECINYNFDFFANGKAWNFLNKGVCLAESKLSGILTDLLDRLLQAEKQHSMN